MESKLYCVALMRTIPYRSFKILHMESANKTTPENKIKKASTHIVFQKRAVDINTMIRQNYKRYREGKSS